MKKINLVLISTLLCISCSSTEIIYQPQDYNDISKSIDIIIKSLPYQSPNHAVKSVDIKPGFIKIVSGSNFKPSYIHFEDVGKMEFYEKSDWKIVTIRSRDRRILYRLYVEDEVIAKEFINAVHTLIIHPEELKKELNASTSSNNDNQAIKESTVLPEQDKAQEKNLLVAPEEVKKLESTELEE